MKITIHHNYEYLLGDIKDIIEGNYVAKKVFCHNRNVVEMVNLQGSPFVVKRYKEPNWLNRVVYTWLRKSKARRAYEYALRLLDEGVETPAPVAYIEIKRGRLFSVGIFHLGIFALQSVEGCSGAARRRGCPPPDKGFSRFHGFAPLEGDIAGRFQWQQYILSLR